MYCCLSAGAGEFWSKDFTRTDLPICLTGSPRALTTGPGGSILCTTDVPLILAQGCAGEVEGEPLPPIGTGDKANFDLMDSSRTLGCHSGSARTGLGILDSLMSGMALRDLSLDQDKDVMRNQENLPSLKMSAKSIPKAFILPNSKYRHISQLWIISPLDQGEGLAPSLVNDGEHVQHTCVDLVLLPQPDLLHCIRDMVVVGTSRGSSHVQIFQVRSCPKTGSPLLFNIVNLSLSTPSISATESRLRGVALLPQEGSGLLGLTVVLGRHHPEVAPSFTSLTKSGLGTIRLSPLMCCTFKVKELQEASKLSSEALRKNGGSSKSDGSGSTLSFESKMEALIFGMEARLENHLGRIEGLLNTVLERVKMLEARQFGQ